MPKLLDDRRLLDFQRRLALLEATKDIRQSDVKPYRFFELAARPFWLDYDVPEKDFIIK